MSAIVDYPYYKGVYMGQEVEQASFPALCAHASRIVSVMTRWRVNEQNFNDLPEIVKTMYQLAICSQIDFLAINGLESMNSNGDTGFTVGKVTVHGTDKTGAGAMSGSVSPAALSYLEQSGLMNPSVAVM